jgi:hypothetical protein
LGIVLPRARNCTPPRETHTRYLEHFPKHLSTATRDNDIVHRGKDLEGFLDVFEELLIWEAWVV